MTSNIHKIIRPFNSTKTWPLEGVIFCEIAFLQPHQEVTCHYLHFCASNFYVKKVFEKVKKNVQIKLQIILKEFGRLRDNLICVWIFLESYTTLFKILGYMYKWWEKLKKMIIGGGKIKMATEINDA